MNKIMTIISCLFLLASCENEIPFNIQDNPPKLIVNALLDDDKEFNDIVVALTGRDEITSVNEAIVRIYLNCTLKDEISTPAGPDSTNLRGTYQTGLKFSAGDRIKIEVQTKNNKHHAWAEVTVPTPIPVEKIDTATIKKTDSWSSSTYFRARTTFTDNDPQKNFYRIVMEYQAKIDAENTEDETSGTIQATLINTLDIREDFVLTEGRPNIQDDNLIAIPENKFSIFDNSLFNGQYTMTTSMYMPNEYSFSSHAWYAGYNKILHVRPWVRIRLISLSKEQFLYLKALNTYESAEYDEYLSHPIKFPSNVNGGTGIVGVCTSTSKKIKLPDYTPEEYSW